MNIKIIQRRYPDRRWDFKAVSTIFNNRDVTYYTLKDSGKSSKGVEVYSGPNYVPPFSTKKKSYSRSYSVSNTPNILKRIVKELIKTHNKIKWSNAKYVNRN